MQESVERLRIPVLVVTDSAASLPVGAATMQDVVVVPMSLMLGGVAYADGDLSPEEVVARAATETVSTSAPSPGEFLKAIASAADDGRSVEQALVLTVSSGMSASYQAARTAATYVSDNELRVVDTGTAAGVQGLVVLGAAEAAAAGGTLDEVSRRAESVASRVRLMASLASLDHLARSGRVPQAAAWAGRSLGVQVMFEFASGEVKPRRPARREHVALERMTDAVAGSRPAGGGSLRAAVLQAEAETPARNLTGMLRQAFPEASMFEAPFSSVMIAHTGPGLVGVAWYWEPFDGAATP
jgi:DegV family protein with EDD domain